MRTIDLSVPERRRLVLATVLIASAIAVAGCATQADYSTSVSEPANGTVIRNLSVYDINELDGARYELEYRSDATATTNYTLETYERTNGSDELLGTSSLTGREPTYKSDLPPPSDPGDERTYRIDIVRRDTGALVDSITVTIERE